MPCKRPHWSWKIKRMLRENNSKRWFTTLFAWLTFIFQELEKEHLSHEKDLLQLKSTILSEQSSLAKEILVEITSKMDTIIQSYNATCSSLLGISLIKKLHFLSFLQKFRNQNQVWKFPIALGEIWWNDWWGWIVDILWSW